MTTTRASTDWRDILARNRRRTYFVIATFVVMYMALGFLIDVIYRFPAVYKQIDAIHQSAIAKTQVNEYDDTHIINIYNINQPISPAPTKARDNITESTSPITIEVRNNINQSVERITAKLLLTGKLFPYATVSAAVGALIATLITFAFSNRIMLMGMGYRLITPESAQNPSETQLYNSVEEMKIAAGLNYMPKIYLIDADYMNAFASGWSEKTAMIAVTQSLLEKLDRDEMQAVVAHELSHIRHQDTRLILIVSVLANLILFIIDSLFYGLVCPDSNGRRRSSVSLPLLIIIIVLRYLLPIVTTLLYLYLSRRREFMADAGAVELTRQNEPLARALIKIHETHSKTPKDYELAYQQTKHDEFRAASYIYSPEVAGINTRPGVSSLWSSHPSLQERLITIGYKKKRM